MWLALPQIKAWCDAAGLKPKIENATPSTERYLDMVGFDEAGSVNKVIAAEGLNLLAIESLQLVNPEDVASRLVRVIDRHMPLSKQARSGLIISFAELVENVHRHAGTTPSAFACAQVYPAKRKITLCIVDTGMGVRASIETGANRTLADRLQDEMAVKLATLPLVTSKPGRHSGYGLYVVSELAVRNGGTFRIFSGNELLTLYRKGWRRQEYQATVPAGWAGTWIAILLNLDSMLPIGEVYSTLPPAEGAEVEDFFT
jgi:anti-sigma regulatory factor (Ser/Thr protein kinase)